ncbi:MAG: CPBP family intramembrane metalloprotease [Alphaproteobacteria bacterium]|nr:CPBP family intramembrane metalloprotease [Alphaproteobacteria bacterium]
MTLSYPADWNALDALLVVLLCAVIPAQALFSSLRSAQRSIVLNLRERALRSSLRLGVPLAILTYDWCVSSRPASALGLEFPISPVGQVALAVAVLASAGLVLASHWPTSAAKRAEALEKLKAAGLLVETRADISVYIPLAMLIGCGSELLFRGFLLWAFVPVVGTIGAIVVAGFAYGFGHGFKTWKDGVGSLISAFLFAAAYALTESLWWLMLFHTVVGLNAGWLAYRLTRASNARAG